ncbi:MAG TPA: NUDIX domain-containing protein [Ktedonobacteraceae bacterium]|jgi:8-oxo-dGTP pyrophosphatase MutT (NUDIX family)|nr:NUDIX domain-containing protein [Ktedonobacteraceae bacterium]
MPPLEKRTFEETYLGQLRKLVGSRPLISPGARAIIRDEHGRFLLIRRRDNGIWGLPAGGLELQESILDCLKREIWEETGLEVLQATPIALYTEPRFAFTTAFGDQIQMFAVAFRVDRWQGTLVAATDETTHARFFAPDELPKDLPALYRETLADLECYEQTGQFILK